MSNIDKENIAYIVSSHDGSRCKRRWARFVLSKKRSTRGAQTGTSMLDDHQSLSVRGPCSSPTPFLSLSSLSYLLPPSYAPWLSLHPHSSPTLTIRPSPRPSLSPIYWLPHDPLQLPPSLIAVQVQHQFLPSVTLRTLHTATARPINTSVILTFRV